MTLTEHCTRCGGGMVMVDGVVVVCPDCRGTTRVARSMHDPRSGIDYEPNAQGAGTSDGNRRAMASVTAPQPPPKPGNAPHTVDLVVADFWARKQMGIAKYGVAHQWDDGRDHVVDAYQEALDKAIYLRAEVAWRERLRELARVVRAPENSAPLAELLDLIEGRR